VLEKLCEAIKRLPCHHIMQRSLPALISRIHIDPRSREVCANRESPASPRDKMHWCFPFRVSTVGIHSWRRQQFSN
jgi:hypothetical protein